MKPNRIKSKGKYTFVTSGTLLMSDRAQKTVFLTPIIKHLVERGTETRLDH